MQCNGGIGVREEISWEYAREKIFSVCLSTTLNCTMEVAATINKHMSVVVGRGLPT